MTATKFEVGQWHRAHPATSGPYCVAYDNDAVRPPGSSTFTRAKVTCTSCVATYDETIGPTVDVLLPLARELAQLGEDVHAGRVRRLASAVHGGRVGASQVPDVLRELPAPQVIRLTLERAAQDIVALRQATKGREVKL